MAVAVAIAAIIGGGRATRAVRQVEERRSEHVEGIVASRAVRASVRGVEEGMEGRGGRGGVCVLGRREIETRGGDSGGGLGGSWRQC